MRRLAVIVLILLAAGCSADPPAPTARHTPRPTPKTTTRPSPTTAPIEVAGCVYEAGVTEDCQDGVEMSTEGRVGRTMRLRVGVRNNQTERSDPVTLVLYFPADYWMSDRFALAGCDPEPCRTRSINDGGMYLYGWPWLEPGRTELVVRLRPKRDGWNRYAMSLVPVTLEQAADMGPDTPILHEWDRLTTIVTD